MPLLPYIPYRSAVEYGSDAMCDLINEIEIEQDNINLEQRLSEILPLELYGVGKAKTFDKLINEIKASETIINWEDNQPIRFLIT